MNLIEPKKELNMIFKNKDCWNCGVELDIEDKLGNRCHTCNASQGYDKEDFGW